MNSPDHQAKAALFKTLAHPARIRVLELLSHHEYAVAEMLPDVGIEKTNLSQQLAVLRRAAPSRTRREGSTVYYSLTSPHVADLLDISRKILSSLLTDQIGLLDDLRAPMPPGVPPPVPGGK